MAITDYDALLAETSRHLGRSSPEFVAAFPTMVNQAEERFWNGFGNVGDAYYTPALRTAVMEASATLAFVAGAATLPADYLGFRVLARGQGNDGLQFIPPQDFRITENDSGNPSAFTVEGSTIKVLPTYDGTLDLLYWRSFPALSATEGFTANALLAAHPMLYVVGVRAEAFGFIRNVEQELKEVQRLAGMVTAANNTAKAQRYSGRKSIRLRSGGIG